MRKGHESASAPFAVGTVWGGVSIGLPIWVTAVMGVLVWRSCMLPDLDHPAKRGALSWIVRWISWRVWRATRTRQDRPKSMVDIDYKQRRGARAAIGRAMDRIGFLPRLRTIGDTHRDFTHSIEGSALIGVGAGGCAAALTLLGSHRVDVAFLGYVGEYMGRAVEHATAVLAHIGGFALWWGVAMFLGCLSHIMADSMTPSGVPGSIVLNRLLGYGTWQRWCVGWMWVPVLGRLKRPRLTWRRWRPGLTWVPVKVPRLSVLRIHGPRKTCEHRGLFHTDSAGEKLLARPLLYAAAVALVAVATGVIGPVIDALTGGGFP